MTASSSDSATAVQTENGMDISITRNGRSFFLLGPAGIERERSILPPLENSTDFFPAAPAAQAKLPVLIGSGTGVALERAVAFLTERYGKSWHLAVIDNEADILAANKLRERFAEHSGIVWLSAGGESTEERAKQVLAQLTQWQTGLGGKAFLPILNPAYLRIDRAFYNAIATACKSSAKADFWSKAQYAKFSGDKPRILLLTSKYFLMGEIISACERLGLPTYLLQVPEQEIGQSEFIEQLLTAVIEFKPDFAFTINHLGVDREGILAELLEKLRLPLASWFVDNPHLILYLYEKLVSPWTSIFTWDADNLSSLSAMGFEHVSYLPLGVDAQRFTPPKGMPSFPSLPKEWDRNISFVGNSMVEKVFQRKQRSFLPQQLIDTYREVAAGFAADNERAIRPYLTKNHPELLPFFDALPNAESSLGYETMLTWEATRQYRFSCIEGVLPFAPLIVGDKGWKGLIPPGTPWHYHSEMNYYKDLPRFYPQAAINFNCTSKQMKGAVNQRVFDVPATHSFLLTDYREQVEQLFEPGKEIICYNSPEEATALAQEYLARPDQREKVAKAARERILREHTYEHRVQSLTKKMREIYG